MGKATYIARSPGEMHILMYSISSSRPSGPPVLAFWRLLFVWTDSASGLFAPIAQEDPCALHMASQWSHQPPVLTWQTKALTLEALWGRGHLLKPELEPELKFAWVWALAWGFGWQSLGCLAMLAWAGFWNLGCTTQARLWACSCCPLGTQACAWFAARIKLKNLIVERVKCHLRCLKPKWGFLSILSTAFSIFRKLNKHLSSP